MQRSDPLGSSSVKVPTLIPKVRGTLMQDAGFRVAFDGPGHVVVEEFPLSEPLTIKSWFRQNVV